MASPPLVPANWQLPEDFRRRLGTSVGRQRLMTHGDQLLIVAHMVPAADEISRRGLLFWCDSDGQWRASNGEPGQAAIGNLIGKYERCIEEFDVLESKARRSDEYLPLLEGLAPVSRAAGNLSDVLQEARKNAPQRRELIDLRDRAYETSRTAELLYQYARNSMEVAIVRRAEEQAHASNQMAVASHRLNTMAAMFFPLATLGAIFGTSLTENWTWSQSPAPFLLFLLTGIISGVVLTGFVNRAIKPS